MRHVPEGRLVVIPDERVEAVRPFIAGWMREIAEGRGVPLELVEDVVAAYEERLRVNIGLVAENAELRKRLATFENGNPT